MRIRSSWNVDRVAACIMAKKSNKKKIIKVVIRTRGQW